MPKSSDLRQIERRADIALKAIDDFWNRCKSKGWFAENPELMNAAMFMEHEVSRSATMIKAHVASIEG